VYEQWNKALQVSKLPDIVQTLAKLNFTARDEIDQQNHKIEHARAAIVRAAEERKQAAILAMAKKN